MDRQPPRTTSDEIQLYIRTYSSLLRSSGEVRVRAFEEAHLYSDSSLHLGAREPTPDAAAFAYSAARLPACIDRAGLVVLGQAHEQFEAAGYNVRDWEVVSARGRRRPLRFDGSGTVAAYITSASDIDDLVPIITAYQIEWNKVHAALSPSALGRRLADPAPGGAPLDLAELGAVLGLDGDALDMLLQGLGAGFPEGLAEMARRPCELSVRLLNGSYNEYQRAAQRWWGGIEPGYLRAERPKRRPVYFVSSNTHSLINLVGGYARAHHGAIVEWARAEDPEGLAAPLEAALAAGREQETANLLYYLMRLYVHRGGAARLHAVQAFEEAGGIVTVDTPGRIDVGAQQIEVGRLRPDRLDPRVRPEHAELLAESDAVILNIDYPLGMAAYNHLSRLAQGVGEIRGVYVMGKAATLNARVGDVILSTVAHDEHSRNTYLFRNCFVADDLRPWLSSASVLDGQKALTVRGAFLQNREYMSVFYREGYTVLEMEAGPYLSAIYEMVGPHRHAEDEIVHLSNITPFDVGLLHYASDTPYSRRQSLLSKSLSYFGVESTYACAIAIARRILECEVQRLTASRPLRESLQESTPAR
jgi:hypothetical protein